MRYLLFLAALLSSALLAGCIDPSVDPVANDDDSVMDDDDDSVVDVDTVTFAFSASDADGVALQNVQVFLGEYEAPTPSAPEFTVSADGEWTKATAFVSGFAPRSLYVCALSKSEAFMAYGKDDVCGAGSDGRSFVDGVVVIELSLDYQMGRICTGATECTYPSNSSFDEWEISTNASSYNDPIASMEYVPGKGTRVQYGDGTRPTFVDGYTLHGEYDDAWLNATIDPVTHTFTGEMFDGTYTWDVHGERL